MILNLVCGLGVLFSLRVEAARPSLKDLTAKLRNSDLITAQFKKDVPDPAVVKKLLAENEPLRRQFFIEVKSSAAFVRGEIDEEKTWQTVASLVQLSRLQMRSAATAKPATTIGDEVQNWFNFAADLAYEEATLTGMQRAQVIRGWLLDELESIAQKTPQVLENAGPWIRTLRMPWPVDRVFLYESKRVLKPASLAVAERVAIEFQRNPYQTAEQILKKIRGGQASDLEFLKSIWRESDLRGMKTEINRLGLLRARVAVLRYLSLHKKDPQSWDDLKKSGEIDQVPMDYFTGRPMEWAQLSAAAPSRTSQKQ